MHEGAGQLPADRDETEAERIDRNWSELIQELRVAQTGLQILAGFLLMLPFQPTFERLTVAQRVWYVAMVSVALLATALVLTPAVAHRAVFRRHVKDRLLRVSETLAKSGLATLGVTLISALGFVFEVVFGTVPGLIASGAAALTLAGLWMAVPWVLLRGSAGERGRPYGSVADSSPARGER